MLDQLKTAKWYWFIPIVSLYCIIEMSNWTLSCGSELGRNQRWLITVLNTAFINAFIFIGLMIKMLEQ